jgi:hypothetical protein
MPIPEISGTVTRKQFDEEYAKLNWQKRLMVTWVENNPTRGTWQVKRYEFVADAIPCTTTPECSINQLNYVQFKPTGVVKTCGQCRKTEGPVSMTLARVHEVRDISVNEAWDIIQKTGQKAPIGLKPKARESFTLIN